MLRIAIFGALALIAFNRVSAAEESSQGLLINVANEVGTYQPPRSDRPWRPPARERSYGAYPVACEAVIFPRSPLCAGRPATFGPHVPHWPWNYWYY